MSTKDQFPYVVLVILNPIFGEKHGPFPDTYVVQHDANLSEWLTALDPINRNNLEFFCVSDNNIWGFDYYDIHDHAYPIYFREEKHAIMMKMRFG